MVKAKGLYKSFDGRTVLTDINVTFETSKVNLIIGQSGSGKTVLLKSLIGLVGIDEGTVFFDDKNIKNLDNKQLKDLHTEIGVVFQGGALFDSFSVIENVKFPLNLFSNMTEKEKIERARFCLNRVNLDDVDNLYPAEISGGMKKRVAIARAIVLNPKYLFCDEPNSGLDPVNSIVIDNLIHEITHEYNMTTIVNTHDMNSVFEIGENIVFIADGNKEWEGNKDNIAQADNKKLNDFIFSSQLYKKIREKL
ncbi:MAG: ATP-binding cassette domain-containing protein [Culturomica sp.]|jgi:phospholipid/cholesterol/gamma-HCH transport system ATP-binding protein|nr:ATP-binding cassette domain-containing protein [Culturomica sp.]